MQNSPDLPVGTNGVAPARERIPWIDVAKAYGIALVFYGHVVEGIAQSGHGAAFMQYKLIYSFHMPLFFVLCGFVARVPVADRQAYLRSRVRNRLLPLLVFSMMALPLHVLRDVAALGSLPVSRYGRMVLESSLGRPRFNGVTWFIACLFSVEVIHCVVSKWTQTVRRSLTCAGAFFVLGSYVTADVARLGPALNIWYVHEAIMAYAFYQLGVAARMSGLLTRTSRQGARAGAAACLGVLMLTFHLNDGPFNHRSVVMMVTSRHGQPVLFAVTAVAGAGMVLLLARATPPSRLLESVGRNTLVLLGLNGVLHEFVNMPVARWMTRQIPESQLAMAAACCTLAGFWLAACCLVGPRLRRCLPVPVPSPSVGRP